MTTGGQFAAQCEHSKGLSATDCLDCMTDAGEIKYEPQDPARSRAEAERSEACANATGQTFGGVDAILSAPLGAVLKATQLPNDGGCFGSAFGCKKRPRVRLESERPMPHPLGTDYCQEWLHVCLACEPKAKRAIEGYGSRVVRRDRLSDSCRRRFPRMQITAGNKCLTAESAEVFMRCMRALGAKNVRAS